MGKYKVVRNKPRPKASRRVGWLPLASIIVVTVALIVAGVWLVQGGRESVSATPEVSGRPQATIDQTTFDYGDVKLGTTVETVFRVSNTGDQDLAILGEPRVELVEGC